jgi:alpha-L-fucosidase
MRYTKMSFLLVALAAGCGFLAAAESARADDSRETPKQHDARMKWWREARFGMFIHWGLYSEAAGYWDGKPTAGAGEWMMNDKQIPLSQYAKLVPSFNPEQFNAEAWVKVAKSAGMKYIVITSKHHEGFGMYHSALTDWCIKSTPFQRDPLKELAAACKKEGLTLCFYYSIMDWHSPLYAPRKPWDDIDTKAPDFEAYDAYMKGQLKELLTGYGPIGLLWFDGNWEDTWTYERGADLYHYLRGLQPGIIINNRVGTGQKLLPGQRPVGDYMTPEQTIPANGLGAGVDWETCMTMNDTWGFKKDDENWKSTRTLIHNLIDCASKGGNYLLNVGPTGAGLIPDASVERLQEIGRWMDVNGQAIYDTAAGPFPRQLPWGRCTSKTSGNNTTLYLHVFEWPSNGELLVAGLIGNLKTAYLLADPKKTSLAINNGPDGMIISLPPAAPDTNSSTIVVQFKGEPEVEIMPILQAQDGSLQLPASAAGLHGNTLKFETGGGHDNIGYWTDPGDWADWDIKATKPGRFVVTASIAAQASGSFDVSMGGKTLHCTAPVTGNYTTFQTVSLGVIEVASAGKVTLAVHPVADGWQPMNLKAIQLKPVGQGRE